MEENISNVMVLGILLMIARPDRKKFVMVMGVTPVWRWNLEIEKKR